MRNVLGMDCFAESHVRTSQSCQDEARFGGSIILTSILRTVVVQINVIENDNKRQNIKTIENEKQHTIWRLINHKE